MRARWLLPLILLALAIGVFLISRNHDPAPGPATVTRSQAKSPAPAERPQGPLPGEALMAGYGQPLTEPIDDLRALDRVISGFFSVVKQEEGFSIGGNEDLAAALRGENAYRQRFLPDDHPAFGGDGRLIDRWDSPLFVHPLSARVIELRSAGPDQKLFTEDDILLEKPQP